jgi:hypothetical protein
MSIRVEYLNPVIGPIADVYVVVWVHRNIRWVVELSSACPVAAKGSQWASVRSELLNPVILMISYVEITLLVYGYAPGIVQLTGSRAMLTPLG